MSEMVERVARAITDHMAGATLGANAWEDLENEVKTEMLALARDVIVAMRAPTDEMLEAGYKAGGTLRIAPTVHTFNDFVWPAMIDAALGDSARETGGET